MANQRYIWPDLFNIGVAPPVERGASALSMVVGARARNSVLDNLPTRYQATATGLLDALYWYPFGPIYNAEPFAFPPNMPMIPNPYSR